MIELPEAVVVSQQINDALVGKQVAAVTAMQSPHKFAWFLGDPEDYAGKLVGKTISGAESHGGMVRVRLGKTSLVYHDGPIIRYVTDSKALPKKHQLLLEFKDSTFLCGSIQMYGGFACFEREQWDSEYYCLARDLPSPLSKGFTKSYFEGLCKLENFAKLSAKLFLATEQRIPGLGNGVLQDILFNARVHPKRKMGSVSDKELLELRAAVVSTLREMTRRGGRDTEKDLFGDPGGYKTKLSRKTVGAACPACAQPIEKAAYAGGSVYFCAHCQPLG